MSCLSNFYTWVEAFLFFVSNSASYISSWAGCWVTCRLPLNSQASHLNTKTKITFRPVHVFFIFGSLYILPDPFRPFDCRGRLNESRKDLRVLLINNFLLHLFLDPINHIVVLGEWSCDVNELAIATIRVVSVQFLCVYYFTIQYAVVSLDL